MNKFFTLRPAAGVPACGPRFQDVLAGEGVRLRRDRLSELQINLGKLCNQACHHCHVDAGPKRSEIMQWNTMQRILDWLARSDVRQTDITGGAPELNPNFRRFVEHLLAQGQQITSRCNLTVLFESEQQDLADWYAARGIRLVCSLPCYSRENVDRQRGKGVFAKSIDGLRRLNSAGYGHSPELSLDLVYNPVGAALPPPQQALEDSYRDNLFEDFGIVFNRLLTITNVPINRFAHSLNRDGQIETYQSLLVDNFNAANVPGLMCRHLLSVDWLGKVYDCDFNQMLELPLPAAGGAYLWELDPESIEGRGIAVDRHCFACTAGAGSSCGGALSG